MAAQLLAVGLDGFDTPHGGCTTHLASLLTLRFLAEGFKLADYPWLIRLNPAIPWKTRGNGAVALLVEVDSRDEAKNAVRIVLDLARNYDVEASKASLVALLFSNEYEFLETRSLRELYLKALRRPVALDEAHRVLRELESNVMAVYGANRRSVVGALASLGGLRPGDDQTFELLAYREPSRWGLERRIDSWSVVVYDSMTGAYTFSNYDYEKDIPLIAPHGPDPVLYGLRGEDPNRLLQGLNIIDAGEEVAHWTLFRTNQATNAHISVAPPCPTVYEPAQLEGRIREVKVLEKGHVLALLDTWCGGYWVAFYRETGRLNRAARLLKPGDVVKVYGVVKPHGDTYTVNAEAIEVPGCSLPVRQVYTLPNTCLVVASARALHHLSKPAERYTAEYLLGDLRQLRAKQLLHMTSKPAGLTYR